MVESGPPSRQRHSPAARAPRSGPPGGPLLCALGGRALADPVSTRLSAPHRLAASLVSRPRAALGTTRWNARGSMRGRLRRGLCGAVEAADLIAPLPLIPTMQVSLLIYKSKDSPFD